MNNKFRRYETDFPFHTNNSTGALTVAPPVSSDTEDTDVVRHSAGKKPKKKTPPSTTGFRKMLFLLYILERNSLEGRLDKLKSNGEQELALPSARNFLVKACREEQSSI